MREFGIRRDPRKSEESFRNPRKLEGFSRNLFGSGFTGSQGFGGIQSFLRDPGGLVGFSGIGGIPGVWKNLLGLRVQRIPESQRDPQV